MECGLKYVVNGVFELKWGECVSLLETGDLDLRSSMVGAVGGTAHCVWLYCTELLLGLANLGLDSCVCDFHFTNRFFFCWGICNFWVNSFVGCGWGLMMLIVRQFCVVGLAPDVHSMWCGVLQGLSDFSGLKSTSCATFGKKSDDLICRVAGQSAVVISISY